MLMEPLPLPSGSAPSGVSADRAVLLLAAEAAGAVERLSTGPITLPVLENANDQPIDLNRVFEGRGVVMTFYFGGWCRPCMAGLADLETARPALAEEGWGVVAVSPESVRRLAATREQGRLGILLVQDHCARFAAALGLAMRVPAPIRAALRGAQVRLADWNGESSAQLPLAASLLITRDRTVRTFLHTEPQAARSDIRAAIDAVLA